jgi:hypothetical protein
MINLQNELIFFRVQKAIVSSEEIYSCWTFETVWKWNAAWVACISGAALWSMDGAIRLRIVWRAGGGGVGALPPTAWCFNSESSSKFGRAPSRANTKYPCFWKLRQLARKKRVLVKLFFAIKYTHKWTAEKTEDRESLRRSKKTARSKMGSSISKCRKRHQADEALTQNGISKVSGDGTGDKTGSGQEGQVNNAYRDTAQTSAPPGMRSWIFLAMWAN